ncbi:hypothetical protein DWF04_006070 [Cereibacter sphaeroides f. sp. denitrificans]|nr:hypothetical protein DWF04_06130 [Cereibacter sphaeroides f. sp. denitrificans]
MTAHSYPIAGTDLVEEIEVFVGARAMSQPAYVVPAGNGMVWFALHGERTGLLCAEHDIAENANIDFIETPDSFDADFPIESAEDLVRACARARM